MQPPENVAPVVAFLCSDACTFTGQYFLVDGDSLGRFPALAPVMHKKPDTGDWTMDSIGDAIAVLGVAAQKEVY
jgi:hypothetical protein